MHEADVAIIGAGAAGLSLAHRLSRPAPGARRPSVVLLDAPPGPLRPPRRTWCFWETGRGPYDASVTRSWQRLLVHLPTGEPIEHDISPLRYKMIHSDDFEALVANALDRSERVQRVEATVESVEGLQRGARIDARTASPVTGRPSASTT